ncbi:MAG TPA: neocarzinostatin apoprotein domain-containing protein [Acidimicrobiales bacterium]
MQLLPRLSLMGALVLVTGLASMGPANASSSKPSAPRSVHAAAASTAATVTWARPTSTGGSPILKYVVTSSPSAKTCTTPKLSCKVNGLKNGTAYHFKVAAYNKNGEGTPSSWSAKVTPKASASGKRFLMISPSTGLSKGESVKVSGSGFTPKDQLFLVECVATSTSQAGCDLNTATPVTVSANGTFPTTTFSVVTGSIGNGTCGTTSANADTCAINAGNAGGGDTSQGLIKFKP